MFRSTMNSTKKSMKRIFDNPLHETVGELFKMYEKKKKKHQGCFNNENINFENKFFIKSWL